MNKKMISCIIPTFNRGDNLEYSIKSVLNQTHEHLELLVIDDHSTDNTKEIVTKYAEVDDRVKYFLNHGKNANAARNTGIEKSQGDFVAFLDDDDTWKSNKLELQYDLLKSLDSHWGGVYCGYTIKNRNVVDLPFGDIKNSYLTDLFSLKAGSTLLLRKQVFSVIGYFDEELERFQDKELMIRFVNKFLLHCVKEPLTIISGHNSPSGDAVLKVRKIFFKKVKEHIEDFGKKNIDQFYAKQYYHQALLYAKESNFNKMMKYFLQSIRYGFLPFKKYIKLIYNYIKSFTN